MKTEAQLKQFFQEELLPGLTLLEQIRKQQLQRQIFILVAVAISIVIALILILPVLLLFFLAIFLVLYFIFFGDKRKRFDFKKAYKEIILKKLIAFILPGFTHTSFQYIPRKTYDLSKLFVPSPQLYTGEDYVQGALSNTAIEFSEILAQDVITENNGRTQNLTVFKGIFFIADFKSEFTADTYIFSNQSGEFLEAFNKWFHDINILRPELVPTENTRLNKKLRVYSTEPDHFDILFTEYFSQLIADYLEKTNANVQMALHQGKLFIAVPLLENLFDVSLYKSILKSKDTEEYSYAINFCISITEAIQNNSRIWT